MCRCGYPSGYMIKPDGIHDLDPCIYVDEEMYANVTVLISRCKKCGNIDLAWFRQENTEKVDLDARC